MQSAISLPARGFKSWSQPKRIAVYLAASAAVLFGVYTAMSKSGYKLALNKSESMATAIFWVTPPVGEPDRGSYIYFRTPPNPYFDGDFVKQVVGNEGDVITVIDGVVFVNETRVGPAKPKTRKGEPLTAVTSAVVPENHLFVAGQNIDSYDSRYDEFGFISKYNVKGHAGEIF